MAPTMPRGLLTLFVFALCFMPSSILVMGWEGGSFQHVDAPTLHTRKHGPCWIIKEDPGGEYIDPSNNIHPSPRAGSTMAPSSLMWHHQ
jgi:hypothetical protein